MFKPDLNRLIRLILLFSIFTIPLFAQNIVIKHYGVNEGLPSSETYWITQDSKGYMWIATDAGVVKYDGYRFNVYNTSKGLPDNTVFKIQEDKHGRIWFASYSGKMAYYLHQTDSIYEIEANEKLARSIVSGIACFAFDDKDTLFVSLSRKGYIKVYPPKYNVFKEFMFDESTFFVKEISNSQYVYGNYMDYSKRVNPELPLMFENQVQQNKKGPLFKEGKVVGYFSSCKQSDTSYLFCNHKSIVQVSLNQGKRLLDSLPVKSNLIIGVFKDHLNRVWVNSHSSGTFLYNTLDLKDTPKRFFEKHSITSVYEDAEHGFWFSTLEDGIFYIPSFDFEFINKVSDVEFEKIQSLVINKGNMEFVSADGFFYDINVLTKTLNKKMKLNTQVSYLVDFNDQLLFCAAQSFIINRNSQEKKSLMSSVDGKLYPYVRLRKAAKYNEQYLVGFYDGMVVKIDKRTGITYDIIKDLPIIFSIYVLDNTIWVGTQLGLYSYSGNKLRFHGDEHPLLKKRIDGMVHVGNKLFLATRGYGVLCYENGKVAQQYSESDGLASNLCKTIIKDSLNNIWVGTNRGVSRLKSENDGTYSVNTINLANGLISSEINQLVIYNNTLYFATNKGIGIVKIRDAFNSTISIPIYVENFAVNNIRTDYLKNKIYSYSQNFIKISYKGIYPKAEGDIKYKYRLEGLDTNWTYSKNTFVQYTTLPSGKYKFIVYAINFDGKLSEEPATISFEINPPFWKTWWFIMVCIGLITLLIYFMYSRRVRLIEKRESEKTMFYKQIAESELKALRAQMNPHFMFNAINSIQTFVLLNDSKSAQKYLTKFSRLIRSVLENSKHETIPLSKEIETLSLYIELECLRASFSFDYDIKVNKAVHQDILQIPPMLLQPYIENAILHGIKPLKGKRGLLQIEFFYENSILKCVIDDNGVGRQRAAELKAKKKTSHQSMGMAVTQERLNVLSKSNLVETHVHIIDKFENDLALGTQVEISIEYLNKTV